MDQIVVDGFKETKKGFEYHLQSISSHLFVKIKKTRWVGEDIYLFVRQSMIKGLFDKSTVILSRKPKHIFIIEHRCRYEVKYEK